MPGTTITSVTMRCPTCGKKFRRDETRHPPFCSERCKLVDLGRWLDGTYSVAGDPASPTDLAREQEGKKN